MTDIKSEIRHKKDNLPWYPEISDEDFYIKLLNKKEFKNTKTEGKEKYPGSNQCTGDIYYVSRSEEPNEDKRKRKIQSKIRTVYEFFALQRFANYVDKEIK